MRQDQARMKVATRVLMDEIWEEKGKVEKTSIDKFIKSIDKMG